MLVYDLDSLQARDVGYIADLCGVCEETVRRWIRGGKLKATKTSRKSGFRVAVLDLKMFLSTNPKYHKAAAKYVVRAFLEKEDGNET